MGSFRSATRAGETDHRRFTGDSLGARYRVKDRVGAAETRVRVTHTRRDTLAVTISHRVVKNHCENGRSRGRSSRSSLYRDPWKMSRENGAEKGWILRTSPWLIFFPLSFLIWPNERARLGSRATASLPADRPKGRETLLNPPLGLEKPRLSPANFVFVQAN